MEDKLHTWFLKQRERHVQISRELICEKARQLFVSQYGSDKSFNASIGWFQNFKKRYGIRGLKISGEQLSSQPELVAPFKRELQKEIEHRDLDECQIYNADESALFWKMLPDKTLVHSKERMAPGRKMCKERVTFLCCANATGSHKLKMVVIGKSKTPRCFKNQQPPVQYFSSKNAWMTSWIFEEWFMKSFVPQVKAYQTEKNLPFKALLLVDNAKCHCSGGLTSEDGFYKMMFLPPNCTSLIQPMDQNAIRITKMFYKKNLLSQIVAGTDQDLSIALKTLNLKDACVMLFRAWENVSSEIIRKCWDNLLPDRWDPEDDLPLALLPQQENRVVNEEEGDVAFIQQMLNNVGEYVFQPQDVAEWIAEADCEDAISLSSSVLVEDDDEELQNDRPKMKHQNASQHFNACIQWAEENDLALEKIIALRELRDKSVEMSLKSQQQTKISDFFQNKN